jgi:hypothetical protein
LPGRKKGLVSALSKDGVTSKYLIADFVIRDESAAWFAKDGKISWPINYGQCPGFRFLGVLIYKKMPASGIQPTNSAKEQGTPFKGVSFATTYRIKAAIP